MLVTAKPTLTNVRPKRATDPYTARLRAHMPVQIDPYMFPTGGLAGLDDAATGTGIDFVDINLTQMHQQIDQAATYAKITAGFSIAGGIASLYLLYLAARKPR